MDYIVREGTELKVPVDGLSLSLASTVEEAGFENFLDIHAPNWPLAPNSVAYAKIGPAICHYLPRHLPIIMEELYIAMMPGALFEVVAPYYTSILFNRDPNNHLRITEDTFGLYSKTWCQANGVGLQVDVDFEPALLRFDYEKEYKDKSEEAKVWARIHNINVVKGIRVVLKAVK